MAPERTTSRRNELIDAAYWEMKARMDPTQDQYPTVGEKEAFTLAVRQLLGDYVGRRASLPSPEVLIELREEGLTGAEIGARYGVSPQAVYRRMKYGK